MTNILILLALIAFFSFNLLLIQKKIKNETQSKSVDIIVTAIAPVKKVYSVNHISNTDYAIKKKRKIKYHLA